MPIRQIINRNDYGFIDNGRVLVGKGHPKDIYVYNASFFRRQNRICDIPIICRDGKVTVRPAPPPPRTNFLRGLKTKSINSGLNILVEFLPGIGFGDSWFSVFRNGVFVESVYADENKVSQTVVDSENGKNTITVLWTGTDQIRKQINVVDATLLTGQKVSLSWNWEYEIIGNPDSELSNWVLNNLKLSNTETGETPTRRTLTISIEEDAGEVTITGTNNNVNVFSGSASAGSTCLLTEENDSGITGSVDVGALASDEIEKLIFRLPQQMKIFRGTSPLPTTEVGSILYDKVDYTSWNESEALTGNTYYYRLKAVSDTGDTGDYGSDYIIEVPATPLPPTNLEYSSGNASATVLSFDPSETEDATYNLYMSDVDDILLDDQTPVATAIADSTEITLPAVSYPGMVRVILRAVKDDIEEKNSDQLDLEYDSSGNYVLPRPNTPYLGSVDITLGNVLTVNGVYNSINEKGTGVTAQLFIRTPTGSYDFDTPNDTSAIIGSGNIKSFTLLDSSLSNGWYYVTAKVATTGGVQSKVEASEKLVYISNTNINTPSVTVKLIGG